MIDPQAESSVRRQCQLLQWDRSGLYYDPVRPDAGEVQLCHRLDELYTAHPFYGVRRMTEQLRRDGEVINPKRVRRLLRQLGLSAVYPKPRLSLPGAGGAGRAGAVFVFCNTERPHQGLDYRTPWEVIKGTL
jgi:putative transposase